MRATRTSGLMSGDGKRSVAAWPKPPRPSSTLRWTTLQGAPNQIWPSGDRADASSARIGSGVRPTLRGDRFYGSPALIAWCRDHGWGWRLRCKQDLRVFDNGGETTLAECFARGEHRLEDVELTGKRARTHVAMLHADGQAEPWIIAMSDRPPPGRARDYGLRWGIEAMFSDFKTRGVQSRGQPD